jgi:hypothetical protein
VVFAAQIAVKGDGYFLFTRKVVIKIPPKMRRMAGKWFFSEVIGGG